MFIKKNHPLYKKISTVGQQVQHNGISYYVVDETFGQYEVEPDNPVTVWKKRTCY